MALFFEANRTEKEMKKKAILLFNVGLLSYKLLKSLSVPSKPSVISRIIKFLTYNKISTENKILAYMDQEKLLFKVIGVMVSSTNGRF